VQLGLELGMCGEVVEDVDEGRVGGVGAGDLHQRVRYMHVSVNWESSEGGEYKRDVC
jgi:hypothetical protein